MTPERYGVVAVQRLKGLIERHLWLWYLALAVVALPTLLGVSGVGWTLVLAVAGAILLLGLAGITAVRVATGEWPAGE